MAKTRAKQKSIKQRILDFLIKHSDKSYTARQIRAYLKAVYSTVRGRLTDLKKEGKVEHDPLTHTWKYKVRQYVFLHVYSTDWYCGASGYTKNHHYTIRVSTFEITTSSTPSDLEEELNHIAYETARRYCKYSPYLFDFNYNEGEEYIDPLPPKAPIYPHVNVEVEIL